MLSSNIMEILFREDDVLFLRRQEALHSDDVKLWRYKSTFLICNFHYETFYYDLLSLTYIHQISYLEANDNVKIVLLRAVII